MRPYGYTAEQKKLLADARSAGEARVVIPLTPEQSRLEREFARDVEDLVQIEFSETPPLSPHPLAGQLRLAREAAGMSLADVGRVAKMTRQSVLMIESGQNANPKIETLRRIASAVGMELQINLVGNA
jgi:DNA-binding XRE family transcriptional regulator